MSYHGMGAAWYEPEYSEFRENVAAVNSYMVGACGSPPRCNSSAATELRDEWIRWFDNLDYVDYYVKCATLPCEPWDQARELRDKFNLANAATPEEREWVERVQETGLTTEEHADQPSRKTSEGTYGAKPGLLASIPLTYRVAGVAALGFGAYLHFAFVRPWSKASARIAERVGD